MKNRTKILIAVCALVVVAAAAVGIYFGVTMRSVPELQKEKLRENPINYNSVYVVGQAPYTDLAVFETQIGLNYYWRAHHTGGNGVELVLQRSKDGQLIVLSETLPAYSNADSLFGKDVSAADLTLEQLQTINLMYTFTDEEGFNIYAGFGDERLADVTVLTLDDVLDFFRAPNRTTAKLYLRFFDEAQIADLSESITAVYTALESRSMLNMAVFCPQSDAAAAAADKACPDLMRAATNAEANALFRDCLSGKTHDALAYNTIYEKSDNRFGTEKFIHYARNLGMAVVLSDVSLDDVAKMRSAGVTAIATAKVSETIQILKDAKSAERESRKAADSTAAQ